MDNRTLFKLGYGLYLLSSEHQGKSNACIINTCIQQTSLPIKISITVNKDNYTTELIEKSGKFCVSILTESADMNLFKRFGFVSGRAVDKFEGFQDISRTKTGLMYSTLACNGYIEGKVISTVDLGTHYLFVAEIVEAELLSGDNSLTYDYYFKHIKPQANIVQSNSLAVSYLCDICGYVYNGDNFPDNYECPICKHGKEVFKKQ